MTDAHDPIAEMRDESYQPDTRSLNFFDDDIALRELVDLYLPHEQRDSVHERLGALGELVGGRLDELAFDADKNPPRLESRDREGRHRQRIVKHPSYVELERLAFDEFRLATVSHKPCFDFEGVLHPVAKYALTYLFAQSEFGLLCPVSMTDSLTRTLRRYADEQILGRCLPGLLSHDIHTLWQGAMFMTERHTGSDVAATATLAVCDTGEWHLHGDKWFCSNVDADVALVLARATGEGVDEAEGLAGVGLYVLPRVLPDGTPNHYSIVRLKDKLGSRSMASGEITLNGAKAWLIGEVGSGFQQIAEMMNQSRLSNGVRATGLMRRACHEAMAVARGRRAFGTRLIEKPLMRRQILKLLLPAEEALAVMFFTADMLHRADEGDEVAAACRRILTPLIKFRACRDARKVTSDAMEVRGGCGYIEEFIEARLVRDSHLGSIWEGTSNIVALDVIRASARDGAHHVIEQSLGALLDAINLKLAQTAREMLAQAIEAVNEVAEDRALETSSREVATSLYRAIAAALLVIDGARIEARGGSSRRLDMAALALSVRFGCSAPPPEVVERLLEHA